MLRTEKFHRRHWDSWTHFLFPFGDGSGFPLLFHESHPPFCVFNFPLFFTDKVFHLSENFRLSDNFTEEDLHKEKWHFPLGFLEFSLPIFSCVFLQSYAPQWPSGSHFPWFSLYAAQCTLLAVSENNKFYLIQIAPDWSCSALPCH